MKEPQVGKDGRGSRDDDYDTTRPRVMEILRAAAAGAASASRQHWNQRRRKWRT